eukprot:CAMPEP_0167744258 /NCGR_PEP_ID=MMETSP0110_2-20121227/2487_1 /TAXON_ID=629695 /ORGANISM="Gymnochlora sp., Strain CCMP2014" /LENGTH=549 /DNA_ID=CAMNT_0007628751 /DNA_START=88 /DNA_END=1737 /DNA_ORIENTATION=-
MSYYAMASAEAEQTCAYTANGVHFSGYEMHQIYIPTPDLCCEICAKVQGCEAFSFYVERFSAEEDGSLCSLQSSFGGRNSTTESGVVSGIVNQPILSGSALGESADDESFGEEEEALYAMYDTDEEDMEPYPVSPDIQASPNTYSDSKDVEAVTLPATDTSEPQTFSGKDGLEVTIQFPVVATMKEDDIVALHFWLGKVMNDLLVTMGVSKSNFDDRNNASLDVDKDNNLIVANFMVYLSPCPFSSDVQKQLEQLISQVERPSEGLDKPTVAVRYIGDPVPDTLNEAVARIPDIHVKEPQELHTPSDTNNPVEKRDIGSHHVESSAHTEGTHTHTAACEHSHHNHHEHQNRPVDRHAHDHTSTTAQHHSHRTQHEHQDRSVDRHAHDNSQTPSRYDHRAHEPHFNSNPSHSHFSVPHSHHPSHSIDNVHGHEANEDVVISQSHHKNNKYDSSSYPNSYETRRRRGRSDSRMRPDSDPFRNPMTREISSRLQEEVGTYSTFTIFAAASICVVLVLLAKMLCPRSRTSTGYHSLPMKRMGGIGSANPFGGV